MELSEQQFEAFVAARWSALTRTAYLLTGNHHDAEDLVQRALMKVAPRWGKLRDNPEPYVRRVMYNENVSRWRRRRPVERLVRETPERPAFDDDATTRQALREALDRLTPKQRAVLVLRFYEDLSEVETAAMLGVGVGTVKSQTRHALERLRVLAPDVVATFR
jgi:RNA polymerase sigma-70 factor (sigma-E family)